MRMLAILWLLFSTRDGQVSSRATVSGGVAFGKPDPPSGPIFILSTGQSNTTGRNDGSGDATVNPNVLAWNGSAWVVMQEGVVPMGTDQLAGFYALSPNPTSNNATWAFAKYVQQQTGRQVRVVILSWGGTSITNWLGTSSTFYSFIRSTMTAIGNPTVNYLIWDQGEADGSMADSTYLADLQSVISQFRAETWFPATTPIILTGLDYPSDNTYAGPHFTMRGLAASGTDPYVHFAETTGLGTIPGGVHWSGPAMVTLGSTIYPASLTPQAQVLSSTQRSLIATYAPHTWPTSVITTDASSGITFHWNGAAWITP